MGVMGRQRTQFDVSLKTLIDHGMLKVGPKSLLLEARNKIRKGDLKEDGSIVFEGKIFQSASSFAVAALRSAGAKTRMTANGWQLVTYNGRTLETYRAEYVSSVYGVSSPGHQAKGQAENSKGQAENSKGEAENSTQSSTPAPPDTPPADGQIDTPQKPAAGTEKILTRSSPESQVDDVAEEPVSQERKVKEDLTQKQTSPEIVRTESTETCSDDATTDLIGNSKKRTAPRPELQMWLKKALKKRHVESQALLQQKSGDVC